MRDQTDSRTLPLDLSVGIQDLLHARELARLHVQNHVLTEERVVNLYAASTGVSIEQARQVLGAVNPSAINA